MRDQNQVAKAAAERSYHHPSKARRTQSRESTSATPKTLTVYSSIPESQDFYAHTFFVTAYVTAPRDARAEHGFLELLPLLFNKLPTNSALSSSLAAVAHCYFGAWEPAIRNAEHVAVQRNYINALRALQLALRNPQDCVSDEVLMAVCLLAFFEVPRSSHLKIASQTLNTRRRLRSAP